jgi:ATP-binding protein involved in chromosome partitioning
LEKVSPKKNGIFDCQIISTSHKNMNESEKQIDFKQKKVGEKYNLKRLGKIIAIASGKGGVGKSTVSSNIASSLAGLGYKVGLLDADIYGPSQPKMFGIKDHHPKIVEKKIQPVKLANVTIMSMGMMIPEDQAIVWRGPMLMKALQQLLTDVDWGDQDIFIIDLPPGTGDIHITLAQKVELAGAIVVSTPQDIALIDAKKAISLFKKTNTKILGLIENMSYFRCTSCGEKHEIFSNGGIPERLGEDNVKILGEIPLIQEIRECSDLGIPFASKAGEGKTIFDEISAKILRAI